MFFFNGLLKRSLNAQILETDDCFIEHKKINFFLHSWDIFCVGVHKFDQMIPLNDGDDIEWFITMTKPSDGDSNWYQCHLPFIQHTEDNLQHTAYWKLYLPPTPNEQNRRKCQNWHYLTFGSVYCGFTSIDMTFRWEKCRFSLQYINRFAGIFLFN